MIPQRGISCSTCGARVRPERSECSECGTPVAASLVREASESLVGASDPVRFSSAGLTPTCPRCGYRGEGVPYFSRGIHVALLVGFVVFTAGFLGAGGLIYYLIRHDDRVCPRCGLGWGKHGGRALRSGASAGRGDLARLPSAARESSARGWSFVLMLLAAVLLVGGIVGVELGPILLGAAAGGGAWVLRRKAATEREERRAALIASLQLPVLKLAAERGGRLTVTDVATQLGWTLPRAEKVLLSLDDGFRVDSRVTDEGVIVYEFLELQSDRTLPGPPTSGNAVF